MQNLIVKLKSSFDAVTLSRQELEELLQGIDRLQKTVDSKQATIDALMLEYCPEDMTEAQLEEWARHQVSVSGIVKDCYFDQ